MALTIRKGLAPHDAAAPETPRVAFAADTLEAAGLARETGLPLAAGDELEGYDLLLVHTPEGLALRDNRDRRVGAVQADFRTCLARGGRPALTRRDPLARAFGREVMTIVDTTAGLGQDAARLAAIGYHVTAIERHPAVAALLRDALARAADDARIARALGGRLRLLAGDARTLLPTLDPPPDAVYLDPMFPPKRKHSAAVRKELRLLRLLAGDDDDAGELFEIARRCARRRVVVKRPDDAPPLAPDPAVSYGGKLVRYDVYHCAA
jgi:16S rRNA (guanine1516-N2)-methyltransferase